MSGSVKYYRTLLVAGLILVILGNLFRIMHWPNGHFLLTIGYVLLAVFYPRNLLQKKDRKLSDVLQGMGILIWAGGNILYYIYWPKHTLFLDAFSKTGLMLWAAIAGYQYFKLGEAKKSWQHKIITCAFVIGGGTLMAGTFFKLMHWPGATALLITGFSIFLMTYFFSAVYEDVE